MHRYISVENNQHLYMDWQVIKFLRKEKCSYIQEQRRIVCKGEKFWLTSDFFHYNINTRRKRNNAYKIVWKTM